MTTVNALTTPPDLIIVPSAGYDTEGYPLLVQLAVCEEVAEIVDNVRENGKKPLVFAQALGLPNLFQHPNDPTHEGPVHQSMQTWKMLLHVGVPERMIARGNFGVDTIGEGLELLTLLLGKHDGYAWMKSKTGEEPVIQRPQVWQFQQGLDTYIEKKPIRVLVIGQEFQVDRSALITSHMLHLAGMPAVVSTIAVPTPEGGIVNNMTRGEIKAHVGRQSDTYCQTWLPYDDIGQFFDGLAQHHDLYNKDGQLAFTTVPAKSVTPHDSNSAIVEKLQKLGVLSEQRQHVKTVGITHKTL